MNRPYPLEVENELLRAAEEHPGQPLTLGRDGIARPARAPQKSRARMLHDSMRHYFRHVSVWGQPGAYRISFSQRHFNWPDHTSEPQATLEKVAYLIGASSICHGSTGNEMRRQTALAVRYLRRFPSLITLS